MLASVLQTARRQNRRNLRGGRFVGSLASLLTRIDQWWRAVAHCSVEEPLDRSQRWLRSGGERTPMRAARAEGNVLEIPASPPRPVAFTSDADASFLPVPRSPRTPVEVALPPVPTFMGRGGHQRSGATRAPSPLAILSKRKCPNAAKVSGLKPVTKRWRWKLGDGDG